MLVNISGGAREATVSRLIPATLYTVQVVAVNFAGTGPYFNTSMETTGEFGA